MSNIVRMDAHAVRRAYARWAPVYDMSFGRIADAGRILAVDSINRRHGKVLEVGVGTGMSLPRYRRHLQVTGIDLSPEMLDKARDRVARLGLDNVEALIEMDAADLAFENETFDTVVAMYVMTVVPDPAKVMRELERVCKPGGELLIVNHFSQERGVRGFIEKVMAPFAEHLGWRPEFSIDTIMTQNSLRLVEERPMRPLGLFTLLRFVRHEAAGAERVARANDGRVASPRLDQEVRDIAI